MVFTIDELSRYTVAQRQELYKIQIAELQAAILLIDTSEAGILQSQIDEINATILMLDTDTSKLKGVVVFNDVNGKTNHSILFNTNKLYAVYVSSQVSKSLIEDVEIIEHSGNQILFFSIYREAIHQPSKVVCCFTHIIVDYTTTPVTRSNTIHGIWITPELNYITTVNLSTEDVLYPPKIYKIIEYDKEF